MSEINWTHKDLGPVDAYAEAVEAGYTGTRAEWLLEVGSVKENALEAARSAEEAAVSAEEAEGSAEDAEESAEEAAGSAASAAASAADALEHTQGVIENWLEENIDPDSGYALDRTLSLSNAATPADITGSLKSALARNDGVTFEVERYDWSKLASSTYTTGWQSGYYVLDTGEYHISNVYISTVPSPSIITPPDKAVFIHAKAPDGYCLSVCEYYYNSDVLTWVRTYGNPNPSNGDATNEVYFYHTPGHVYRVSVGRFSNYDAETYAANATFVKTIIFDMYYSISDKYYTELKRAEMEDIGGTFRMEYEPEYSIVSGGINVSNGGNLTNSAMARSQYFAVEPGTTYSVRLTSSNYKFKAAALYTKPETSGREFVRSDISMGDDYIIFTTTSNEKGFRFSVTKPDETTAISSSEYDTIRAAVKIYTYTDKELTTENVPADAAVTGAKFDYIIDMLSQVNPTVLDWAEWYSRTTHTLGWMTGYFNLETGEKEASNVWIRNVAYHRDMSDYFAMIVEPPEGYRVCVCEWDQDDQFIKGTYVDRKTALPTNGHLFAFFCGRFDDYSAEDHITAEFISQIKVTLLASGDRRSIKKNRTGDFEFFSVIVDRPLAFGDETVTTEQQEVECVLRLPETYRTSGRQTQLVLACHGAAGYINKSETHWYNSAWKSFMDSLLAAGYAVFDANVLPTDSGSGSHRYGFANGSPLYINVLKRAYDYIQHNYNVTEKIFVHGTSMGGVGATHFANVFPSLVLAESSFAGRDMIQYVADVYNDGGIVSDYKDAFAQAFGYTDWNALKTDKFSHVEGTSPTLSLITYNNGIAYFPPDRESAFSDWGAYFSAIAGRERTDPIGTYTSTRIVPYKGWYSWSDALVPPNVKVAIQKAHRLGGNVPYELVLYESYNHSEMSYGQVEDMREQLIAWYQRWEHYEHPNDSDDEGN